MLNVRPALAGALAVAALSAACATTGAVPKPFPMPSSSSAKGATPTGTLDVGAESTEEARVGGSVDPGSVVGTALALRGVRYRNGGSDPSGFDCSGFTQYVFARHGWSLPREVRDQFHSGTPVGRMNLRAGDLLFFSTTAPGASHVGIALDSHRFVHAPSSSGVVRVEQLDTRHWLQRYIGARRIPLE